MGLFGKKVPQPAAGPAIGLAAPVIVKDGDLGRVRDLMDQFSRAVGSDSALRAFGVSLNRAGGYMSDANSLDAVQKIGPAATKRPWLWLAAVAREALAQGDQLLVGKIALAAWFWDTQITPHLGIADFLDGIVDSLSGESRAQLFSAGRQALSGLPADAVVMETSIATMRADDVLVRIS